MSNIAFFGGTFNPVHIGHVRLAAEARERFGFERVELLPAAVPPHRSDPDMLDFETRFELVRLAVRDADGLAANPIESARSGPSYTFDTLAELKKAMPGDELWFIMGAGEFTALESWRKGLQIPALANLAVADRGAGIGQAEDFLRRRWPEAEQVGLHRWRNPAGMLTAFFHVPVLEISGTEIRGRWRKGLTLRGLVDRRVEEELQARRDEVDAAWRTDARD
jgi:nicotinate-nucleotide adenylyltransferase